MPKTFAKKVLLIGWDAADWKVIHPLLDAGQMPHLERMVNEGVIGNLATLYPILSPMLWTSIATGKRAWKHGIHGFIEPDPNTGWVRPITNLSRKTKAVWNILNQNGQQCNIVGWWPSHPAEPLNGVMVSNHYQQPVGLLDAAWPMRPNTVHPKRLEPHLSKLRIHPLELEEEHLLPFVPNAAQIDQQEDSRLVSVAKILAECSTVHAAATGIMQLEPWDFMAIYYDAIDHFSHGFMKYHPPRPEWIKEDDYEMFKDVINGAYRYHDMMLGVLLQLAGEDTTVMLISDHGFHPDHLRPRILPNEPAGPAAEHRPYGIFAMMGPGVKQDERIYGATLLDIAPTILQLFDLPIGADMDGRVLAAAFDEPPAVSYLESWDQVEGDTGQHPPDARLDSVEAKTAIDQLVALGYIDEPDEDQEVAVAETIRELETNLATSYIDDNRYKEAAELLERLWEQWPEELRFGVKLIECYRVLERVSEARRTLDLVKERKRKYTEQAVEEMKQLPMELQGKKYQELDRKQQRKIRSLRARAGTNLPALAFLEATVMHAEGQYKEALKLLNAAQRAEMNRRPSVHNKRGEILLDLKRWEEAEACFEESLKIDPINPYAHLGLCRSYLPRRKNRRAADAALASIGLLFYNPQAHFLHGVALHRCGHVELAVKALDTALRQNSNFPEAHKRLAFIYRKRLGDIDKAEYHEQRVRNAGQFNSDQRDGPKTQQVDRSPVAAMPESADELEHTPAILVPDDVVTVVSGLPRSGTSMMMQMLAAGGLPVLTDGIREADESNPLGYLEFDGVKRIMKDREWLADAKGKAVKIVAQLLKWLSIEQHYKIIFMDRDLDEVLTSQAQMLSQLGGSGAKTSRQALADTFAKQLGQARTTIARHPRADMITVRYRDTIQQPLATARRVAAFLGRDDLDVASMAKAVDAKLYRQRTDADEK